MYLNHHRHSRYQICFYILWLVILKFLSVSAESVNTDNSDVCTTPGCEAAANLIKDNIDVTQDPCEDFYNFACGKLKKNIKIDPDELENGRVSLLRKAVRNNITNALTESVDPNEPRIFKLVKNHHKACMDLPTIENRGLQPLLKIINSLGGWPMAVGSTWDENKFDWIETLYKLRQLGYWPEYILKIKVVPDTRNRSKSLFEIREGVTNIEAEWDSAQIQSYTKYMVDTAELFGADVNVTYQEALDVVAFETRLLEYANSSYERAVITSIEDLYFGAPQIPWLDYINNMTSPVANFTVADKVQAFKPVYLLDLPSILQKVSKRTLANYLIWRVIDESATFLSTDIRQLRDNFYDISIPRDDYCLRLVMDDVLGMPIGIDALYFKKYVNDDTKKDVENLITDITSQLELHINQLTWLDNQTRDGALHKARLMKTIVGFPDKLYNDMKMDNFSSTLNIDPNNHFQNVLNTMRYNNYQYISNVHGSSDNSDDTDTYTEVNAYYHVADNRLVINAPMLQSPVYSSDWPNYMKYGSLGITIGHEMMHAFDIAALYSDATKNNNQWFTNQSALEYKNKFKCFVQHYGNYFDKKINLGVDGRRTLNENLADYVGTILGYSGYKKWVKENGKEPLLPGLNYTPEQIFWIISTNKECRKSRTIFKEMAILNDGHTPDKFRVFGIVKNSVDFAKDFNCPVGSRMNPKDKCSLAK